MYINKVIRQLLEDIEILVDKPETKVNQIEVATLKLQLKKSIEQREKMFRDANRERVNS